MVHTAMEFEHGIARGRTRVVCRPFFQTPVAAMHLSYSRSFSPGNRNSAPGTSLASRKKMSPLRHYSCIVVVGGVVRSSCTNSGLTNSQTPSSTRARNWQRAKWNRAERAKLNRCRAPWGGDSRHLKLSTAGMGCRLVARPCSTNIIARPGGFAALPYAERHVVSVRFVCCRKGRRSSNRRTLRRDTRAAGRFQNILSPVRHR